MQSDHDIHKHMKNRLTALKHTNEKAGAKKNLGLGKNSEDFYCSLIY